MSYHRAYTAASSVGPASDLLDQEVNGPGCGQELSSLSLSLFIIVIMLKTDLNQQYLGCRSSLMGRAWLDYGPDKSSVQIKPSVAPLKNHIG